MAAAPAAAVPLPTASSLGSIAGSLAGGVQAAPAAAAATPAEALSVLVCVIGGGMSGLCVANRLVARRGRGVLPSLVVLEREAEVGGTWACAANYPGAACDVPSHLYAYSFALNPHWSRTFSKAVEIREYLARVAADTGLAPGSPSLRTGVHVDSATWDARAGLWRVCAHSVVSGARLEVAARFLVSAVGALYVPALPAIPGAGDFLGSAFHAARWRSDVPIEGRRVAVVGVGASAVQIVPEVAKVASHLDVFQRTPSWIIARRDRPSSARARWLFSVCPPLLWAWNLSVFVQLDAMFHILIRPTWSMMRPYAIELARRHLRRAVPAGPLRDALTPHYEMGCKRVLLSNDFYPALTRPNVELVTSPITRITPRGLLTADGAEHPVDVLVYATGFDVIGSVAALPIIGAGGRDLREQLRGDGESYLGVGVAGFPNFFMCLGPNTGLGHNSIIAMVECQVRLMLPLMERAEAAGPTAAIAPRAAAQKELSARTQDALKTTVWGACSSWYNNQGKHNTTMWPWTVTAYWWETLWPRYADFEVTVDGAEQ